MAFRQAHTVFVDHERTVIKGRRRVPKSSIQQQLAKGGKDQIDAQRDLGDLRGSIASGGHKTGYDVFEVR